MLPPSPTVFLVNSIYLGGLTFQFLRLPIGPLYHCHNNLEAFLLSQVIRTIWTIYQIKSPFPNSESQASNSFSGTVLLLQIKDRKFSCLQRCKDAPTFKSAKNFLRFFCPFCFLYFRGKNWQSYLFTGKKTASKVVVILTMKLLERVLYQCLPI